MIQQKNSIVQERFTIGEKEFLINKWNPMKALVRGPKIGKMIGVPFLRLQDQGDETSFMEAAYMLFDNLDEGQIEELLKLLCDGVKIFEEGNATPVQVDIDKHFVNDLGGVVTFAKEVLMQHYGSLFSSAVTQEIKDLGAVTAAMSTL